MPTTDEFVQAAYAAAPAFGLEPDSVRVLSHSENVVCDLDMGEGRHLVMRLHRPRYNSLDELRSEVQLVASLGRVGVPVPTAIPAIDGGFYGEVTIANESRYVGVIDWVDGEPLGSPTDAGDNDVVAHYGRIGEIAAQICSHNSTWDEPEDFVRRRWDADGLVGADPLWGRFWEVARLSDSQRDLFRTARQLLHDELAALPTGPEHFGLIHADLHLGNLMADGDALTVIDFDDAGYGWFAHELAVSLHPMLDEPDFDAAKTALIDGFRRVRPLSDETVSLVDTFLTVRCLMIVGWLAARPELEIYDLFDDLVTQTTAQTTRYLSMRGNSGG